MTNPTYTSIRYQRLLECISMVLEKCHSQLDVENVIKICYGGGDNTDDNSNDIFCTMLHNVLQQFHTDVTNDITAFLQENNVQEKLRRLEAIIRKVDYDIEQTEMEKKKDKETAMAAIQKVKALQPNSGTDNSVVSPQDLLQYQSLQQMMKTKKQLQKDIELIQHNIQQLEAEKEQYVKQMNETYVQGMNTMQMELEKSADICSMVK